MAFLSSGPVVLFSLVAFTVVLAVRVDDDGASGGPGSAKDIVITIGISKTNEKCVGTPSNKPVSCAEDAGAPDKRVNEDFPKKDHSFIITVSEDKKKVCCERPGGDAGWSMNLKIKCQESVMGTDLAALAQAEGRSVDSVDRAQNGRGSISSQGGGEGPPQGGGEGSSQGAPGSSPAAKEKAAEEKEELDSETAKKAAKEAQEKAVENEADKEYMKKVIDATQSKFKAAWAHDTYNITKTRYSTAAEGAKKDADDADAKLAAVITAQAQADEDLKKATVAEKAVHNATGEALLAKKKEAANATAAQEHAAADAAKAQEHLLAATVDAGKAQAKKEAAENKARHAKALKDVLTQKLSSL